MAELKTKTTQASVDKFLEGKDERKKQDYYEILNELITKSVKQSKADAK